MTEKRSIQILPDVVTNKIAAGEVVERPASVVKELLENALDAQADQIDVDVVAGGKKLIRVADNGWGMSRDDALLAIERHATSKIRDIHDVEHIASLGFRGEALAAIASVSQFSLMTRPADTDEGTEILINGGRLQEVRDAGCPQGTEFHIRQLFYNIPARKKFLRSEQTEIAHIKHYFMLYALSYPHVAMTLRSNGKELYRVASASDVAGRIGDLFGNRMISTLRTIDYADDDITISGYAGLPQSARSDRSEQFVFVNHRPAGAPVLAYAINEVYGPLIHRGRYPSLFLYIDIRPDLVDVNVHPTKKDVRFRKSGAVRDALINALTHALSDKPTADVNPVAVDDKRNERVSLSGLFSQTAKRSVDIQKRFDYPRLSLVSNESGADRAVQTPEAPESSSRNSPWADYRIIGQLQSGCVILETHEGMVLMDTQAAHERVLYERLLKASENSTVKSQSLLSPETVELNPRQSRLIQKNIQVLRRMGFGVAEFGDDTFLVDSLPSAVASAAPVALLQHVADDIEKAGVKRATSRWMEETVARSACAYSVKGAASRTEKELSELVNQLAQTDMPYTCPHGRPTVIFMSFNELASKFGKR